MKIDILCEGIRMAYVEESIVRIVYKDDFVLSLTFESEDEAYFFYYKHYFIEGSYYWTNSITGVEVRNVRWGRYKDIERYERG